MKIFLSNDDGIDAIGILALAKQLSQQNELFIIAPDGNRSVSSHSLTINKGVSLCKVDDICCNSAYKTSGTPADCVKLLAHKFTDFTPDVVVSGINNAHNLGTDIFYSGTVAIAYEASYYGYVSFAFSACSLNSNVCDEYAKYAEYIIKTLLPYSKEGTIWNVNFPDINNDIKGIKITKLGGRTFDDKYVEIGENLYQLRGVDVEFNKEMLDKDEDYDLYWIRKGYITVTPLVYDRTDYVKLDEINKKCIKF